MSSRRRLAALLALAALAACSEAPAPEEDPGTPVVLHPVVAHDLVERIESTGQLLAVAHAQIAAEVGGRVTEVVRDEGAALEAGDAVLAIDPERRQLERDSARARVDEARANLAEKRREHQRLRDLRARKVASQTQLDQAATDLELARSRLAAAEAESGVMERMLREATVSAPFAGLVARRFVSRGEYVSPGQPLFELVSLDPIEVEFSVPEVDSGRVSIGQTVDVRLAPFPDEVFAANVSFVSPTIDPATRTLRVKAQLRNPDARLRPGLFARIDLGVSRRENVPMVPEEAILQRSDGPVVFRVDGENRVSRVRVRTGQHHEGFVEIVAGVETGDLIVSRGQARLADGQRVVPRNPDGTLLRRRLPPVAPPAPEAS